MPLETAPWTTPATLALETVIALLYLYLGGFHWRRGATPGSHAILLFALFWFGLGLYGLVESLWGFAFLVGLSPLPVALAVLHWKVLFGLTGFFGLVSYLLYIYTGRGRLLRPLAVGYLVLFGLVEYSYAARVPVGQAAHAWGVGLVYANPQGPEWSAVVALMFIPPMLGAVAYASLLRVLTGRAERFRVAMISLSLFTFFAGLTLSWLGAVVPGWGLLEKGLALLATLGVIVAVRPPAWVRRRLEARPQPVLAPELPP